MVNFIDLEVMKNCSTVTTEVVDLSIRRPNVKTLNIRS